VDNSIKRYALAGGRPEVADNSKRRSANPVGLAGCRGKALREGRRPHSCGIMPAVRGRRRTAAARTFAGG
jgi:hypothetical protein